MTTADVTISRPRIAASQLRDPVVVRVSPEEALDDALQLGRAFAAKEPSAFEDAYRRYAPSVVGFLSKVMGSSVAEDISHEVFIEAWRRAPGYEPERSSLGTWLMVIARSRAIDHYRRDKRRGEQTEITDDLAVTGPDGIDDLHAEWGFAALLADLDVRDRRLLSLRFRHGLSQSEIAERTGMPIGSVKTRMTRALAAMRRRMPEGGVA